jgi:hypothetical protein
VAEWRREAHSDRVKLKLPSPSKRMLSVDMTNNSSSEKVSE